MLKSLVVGAVAVVSALSFSGGARAESPAVVPRPAACTWNWVAVSVVASTPTKSGTQVVHKGTYNQTAASIPCSSIGFFVTGQRKVCGFWGCNWEDKASAGGSLQSVWFTTTTKQTCASGTNRYRTVASYRHIDVPGGSEASPITNISSAPQITC